MYDKWKRAVVNLEGATDSVSATERMDAYRRAVDEAKGGPPSEEAAQKLLSGSRDVRSQGTAIFLRDDASGHRFLATARHVLFDEIEAKRRLQELGQRYAGMPPEMLERIAISDAERARDQIFSIIFRVPSLTEIASGGFDPTHDSFLMNLGAGVSWMLPYSFSNAELDLGVISLDGGRRGMNTRFADKLESLGHSPIPFSQIADAPTAEGADLCTVGYPGTTSPVGMLDLPPALLHWGSRHVSLPTFSFGKVAMLHELLPYFWGDLTIYPGNSGGPVIENESLVGVVVQQAVLREPNGQPQRVPFCKAIKCKYLKELLAQQIEKDAAG